MREIAGEEERKEEEGKAERGKKEGGGKLGEKALKRTKAGGWEGSKSEWYSERVECSKGEQNIRLKIEMEVTFKIERD